MSPSCLAAWRTATQRLHRGTGGDAGVFKEGQALATEWPSPVIFQTQVGLKTGDPEGGPSVGDPAVLKYL